MRTVAKQSAAAKPRGARRITNSWVTLVLLCIVILLIAIMKYVIPTIPQSMSSALGNPRAHMDHAFYISGEVVEVRSVKGALGQIAVMRVRDRSGEGWVVDYGAGKNPPSKGDHIKRHVKVDTFPVAGLERGTHIFMVQPNL